VSTYWFLPTKKEFRDFNLSGFNSPEGEKLGIQLLVNPNIEIHGKYSLSAGKIPNLSKLTKRVSSLYSLVLLNRNKIRTLGHQQRSLALLDPKHYSSSVIVYSWVALKKRQRLFIQLLSLEILFYIFRYLRILIVFIETIRVRRHFNFNKGDVAIYPYSAFLDGIFDSWIQILQFLGVKTIAYQSNWDNLSSKCFIGATPDFFCLWGMQSVSHIKNIHEIKDSRIRIVGSPRFNQEFWSIASNQLNYKSYDEPLKIFVAGTGDGIDDYDLFKYTSNSIKSLNFSKKPTIIYKPHPFTRSKEIADKVISDFETSEHFNFLVLNNDIFNNNEVAYLEHLCSANLLISHLSTLCLESLFVGTPVCIPLFIAEDKKFNWKQALDGLEHYKGFRLIRDVSAPSDVDEFNKVMKNLPTVSLEGGVDLSWFCSKRPFFDSFKTVILEAQANDQN
jgi:hypothetical protein